LRNRSEILPSISRYNSVNLKTRTVNNNCIFSPSKYDTIDTEEDEERLLVFSEDQTEIDPIINIRKQLEGLDLDEVIKKINFD